MKYFDLEIITVARQYISDKQFVKVKARRSFLGLPYGATREVQLFQIASDWHDMDTGEEMPDQTQLKRLFWAAQAKKEIADAVARRMEEADRPKERPVIAPRPPWHTKTPSPFNPRLGQITTNDDMLEKIKQAMEQTK